MNERNKYLICLLFLSFLIILMLTFVCIGVNFAQKIPQYAVKIVLSMFLSLVCLGCFYGTLYVTLHFHKTQKIEKALQKAAQEQANRSTIHPIDDPTRSQVIQLPAYNTYDCQLSWDIEMESLELKKRVSTSDID